MKNIVILGSTGSIGTQSLDIVRKSPDMKVLGLSAHQNIDLLEKQAREFMPKLVCAGTDALAKDLALRLADTGIQVVAGTDGMCTLATLPEAEIIVTSVMGIAGLKPTIAAIKAKKDIALANKETLVAAGALVTKLARENGVKILPVDSEHSAVFQSLAGLQSPKQLRRIILTASGGPFRTKTADELQNVTKAMALKHPNWSMGAKITIDSSTLVNKGLEVIEAHWLFDAAPAQIDVVVHPQSIIHSMVEFVDGSVIAQLGLPDMRLPIAYALTYPDRAPVSSEFLSLADIGTLTFEKPRTDVFPALPLAYEALKAGGTMCAVYNGADEAAVTAFLNDKIEYTAITDVIEKAMASYTNTAADTLDAVLAADAWARDFVASHI